MKFKLLVCLLILLGNLSCKKTLTIETVDEFTNKNNPIVLYWFWDENTISDKKYMSDLDSIVNNSPFDLIFLTARDGVDFYDYDRMHPIFSELVDEAHKKGIKIGLQLWDSDNDITYAKSVRLISESETQLDNKGQAIVKMYAKHVRDNSINRHSKVHVTKTDVFKAWAFKKDKADSYISASLVDVTSNVKIKKQDSEYSEFIIDCGSELSEYYVYILAQNYYNWNDTYGGYVSDNILSAFKNYSDIPFDATALDEYTHIRITPPWNIGEEYFTERIYSPAMDSLYNKIYQSSMSDSFLSMRYMNDSNPASRIRSINRYMDIMRSGPLKVEKDFYRLSKEFFGDETFIGVHNTFHNSLVGDELWQTGGNWWTVPRDYGHTDENSIKPTQMGIAQGCSKNVLYNMYYHASVDTILKKATTDLAYGIRTHYHAYNDSQSWGVKLESPEFLDKVCNVENAAVLLNHFNPSLPQMDVLFVFAIEALQNSCLKQSDMTKYLLNSKVDPEKIVDNLWKKGYRISLVSSDAFTSDRVQILSDGRISYNGHVYHNMVLMYPEFIKKPVLKLLSDYVEAGGKLLVFGDGTYDFDALNISDKISHLGKNISNESELEMAMKEAGVLPDNLYGTYSYNEDGSYVQTFYPELVKKEDVPFNFDLKSFKVTGLTRGMIALDIDDSGEIIKLSAVGLSELNINGNVVLQLSSPSDIFYVNDGKEYKLTLQGNIEILTNNL